ncbi:hypothetical protein ANCCAN_00360 [Ancylostoma caninum]|uniref:Protein quiver n=1 Tax=Ancylostoma caninum TaxID=29170 RepID=A0A368HC69_ANCCA|nr:hypothetical protein ANCCAN_00360 [Ancylostoma caninum]
MNLLVLLCLIACCIVGAFGIQCYICNSITHPECENDYEKFLRLVLRMLLILNCTHSLNLADLSSFQNCPVKSFGGRKAVPPIGCRKYRQTANQETSLVRECAYLGEDVEGKSNKGSLGVSRIMSQCSDRPACNSATSTGLVALLVMPFVLFVGN